jgi:hypothetical protein
MVEQSYFSLVNSAHLSKYIQLVHEWCTIQTPFIQLLNHIQRFDFSPKIPKIMAFDTFDTNFGTQCKNSKVHEVSSLSRQQHRAMEKKQRRQRGHCYRYVNMSQACQKCTVCNFVLIKCSDKRAYIESSTSTL